MNELASLGLILLFALFAGHVGKLLKLPEVTGYIGAGVVVGPYVFGWVSHDNLETLAVFSEVALGLILFSIGSVFEFSRMGATGGVIASVTLIESTLAAVLVTGGMLMAGQSWAVALLLGAIAIETAAASTLMVMRECNSAGPLTDTLTGVIGINNVLCLGSLWDHGSPHDARVCHSPCVRVSGWRCFLKLVWRLDSRSRSATGFPILRRW
jgi:Kef-type K+ transport system membrane component KefB